MNVAAKGLLPAETRAKEALALKRQQQLEAEAEEARRLQAEEDAKRKAAVERENARERALREQTSARLTLMQERVELLYNQMAELQWENKQLKQRLAEGAADRHARRRVRDAAERRGVRVARAL